MKSFFLMLCASTALLFGACATAPQTALHYAAPTVAPVKASVTLATADVSQAQVHAKTVTDQVTQAQAHAKAATTSLAQIEAMTKADPKLSPLAAQAATDVDALSQNLLTTQSEVVELQKNLADAQTAHTQAQSLADSLQTKVDTQTSQLNTAIDKLNAAVAQDAIDKAHAHRLKLWACMIGAALAGFIVWKFSSLLAFLGPWGMAAYAVVPALAFGFLWMIL